MWRKARSVISFSRVDIDGGDWTTKQTSLVVETGVVQQVVVAAFFPNGADFKYPVGTPTHS